jgi:hypothetical protein
MARMMVVEQTSQMILVREGSAASAPAASAASIRSPIGDG